MKVLLIHPPTVLNSMPMAGISALSGLIKHLGHVSQVIDLNNEFVNYCCSEKFFLNLQNIYSKLSSLNDSEKEAYLEIIAKHQNPDDDLFTFYSENAKEILSVFKGKDYYDLDKLRSAYLHLRSVIKVSVPIFKYCLENEVEEGLNIFKEFLDNLNNRINEFKPDIIGFSIEDRMQKEIALSIIGKIESKEIPLVIGGGDVTFNKKDYIEVLKTNENVDYIIYGDGEESWQKILKSFEKNNEIIPNKIPSLIYKKKTEIIQNKLATKPYKNLYYWDFSYANFESYYSPLPVLPVETSRSCYWRGCYFCNFHKGCIYYEKTPSRLVKELEYYIKTYGVKNFQFVDLAVSPAFLDKFSSLLIKKKLDIKYSLFLRCEPEFTYQMLEKAYKSGLRLVFWGIESGSDRLLKAMNKGTTVDNMHNALKNATKANIVNCAFLMYGVPTETEEDLRLTLEFLENSTLDKFIMDKYFLSEDSYIDMHREDFGIDIDADYDDVSFYNHSNRANDYQNQIKYLAKHSLTSTRKLPPAAMMTEVLLYSSRN